MKLFVFYFYNNKKIIIFLIIYNVIYMLFYWYFSDIKWIKIVVEIIDNVCWKIVFIFFIK